MLDEKKQIFQRPFSASLGVSLTTPEAGFLFRSGFAHNPGSSFYTSSYPHLKN